MTREEAIKELSYIADEMPSMECRDWKEAIHMAIKALEQEPILDKVRADVINIADGRRSISVRSVINIIDKHRVESEDKNET